MKKYIVPILLLLCFFVPALTKAQRAASYERAAYNAKGDTLPYRILFPQDFDPAKKYPLVFVLHGAGERGNNNESQLLWGGNLFLRDTIRERYPAIVVFPQCPAEGWWASNKFEEDSVTHKTKFIFLHDAPPSKSMHALLGLVDEMLDKPYINKHQVYIGGLSMGGMGTFDILGRKPNIFAAAFAICGGDNTLNAKKYAKKVPLWVFHGAKDSVVPESHSEAIVAALNEAGGNPKFTVYPNDDHNSWNDAFAEPMFMAWLFSHKK